MEAVKRYARKRRGRSKVCAQIMLLMALKSTGTRVLNAGKLPHNNKERCMNSMYKLFDMAWLYENFSF
jgi:hypothetical protein